MVAVKVSVTPPILSVAVTDVLAVDAEVTRTRTLVPPVTLPEELVYVTPPSILYAGDPVPLI